MLDAGDTVAGAIVDIGLQHHSVDDLEATIRAYIDSYNERATPFIWTKTAEYLIGKINRKRIINTRH